MSDAIIACLRQELPPELLGLLSSRLDQLEQGKYKEILTESWVQSILEHLDLGDVENAHIERWRSRVGSALAAFEHTPIPRGWTPDHCKYLLVIIAYTALQVFLQANVTGPPLNFEPLEVLDVGELNVSRDDRKQLNRGLLASSGVDGEAVYKLVHHVELFALAKAIILEDWIVGHGSLTWLRLRVNYVHQKLLSEVSPTLQKSIYEDMQALEDRYCNAQPGKSQVAAVVLLELASIHGYYGSEKEARSCIDRAVTQRRFQFALTGLLGKRTRYQEKETSQLVVLAKSHDAVANGVEHEINGDASMTRSGTEQQPQDLDLNDDTVLEKIAFTEKTSSSAAVVGSSDLPEALISLDPSNQPLLHPVDSAILLALASSITNTRPDEGLTREETLPYAQRVLEGGSSNWQVYTQALLVRSRIEGYRSRTVERGLLQLQALVDQVIAETTETPKEVNGTGHDTGSNSPAPAIHINGTASGTTAASSTFLPRPEKSDSAPAHTRLAYLPLLNTPFRWTLEAELAARWTSLGGLRTALEIYERLEMWAEAALCWAATEHEDKATRIIRRLLYEQKASGDEENLGDLRDPAPADAPRLHCILGDLSTDINAKIAHYELAWSVSIQRYSRAQRSLGRLHYSRKDFRLAAAAYNRSLKVNALNGQAWFAMGCALLELEEWETATEAFSRVVKLDETDAEGWSNLAAGLLSGYEAGQRSNGDVSIKIEDDEEEEKPSDRRNPQQPLHTALTALKRAAQLKHDSSVIWQNVLTVAMSISPPAYLDALVAQRRIIDLRGKPDGENCIDINVLEAIGREVMTLPYRIPPTPAMNGASSATTPDAAQQINAALSRGIPRMYLALLTEQVVPLITASARLWRLVSRIRLWQDRIADALQALESAWRAAIGGAAASRLGGQMSSASLSVPTRGGKAASQGISGSGTLEDGNEGHWDEAVEATLELVDGYESLGGRTDESGEVVLQDWKFKARSAIRGVMGKGRELWSETEGYERLKERLDELRT